MSYFKIKSLFQTEDRNLTRSEDTSPHCNIPLMAVEQEYIFLKNQIHIQFQFLIVTTSWIIFFFAFVQLLQEKNILQCEDYQVL